MLYYKDIIHPSTRRPALNPTSGEPLNRDTISGGQLAFAKIAKLIVDHGRSLDEDAVEELSRLLRQ